MTNNVGTVSTNLSRTIGETTTITDATSITAVAGFVDVGFIGFDNKGTIGICTSFTRDTQDRPTYIFKTCSLDTQIDIDYILSQPY